MNWECVICGDVHPPCSRCSAPVRCSHDEPRIPFSLCDDCDEDDKREFWAGIPRDDWDECEIPLSSSGVQKQGNE